LGNEGINAALRTGKSGNDMTDKARHLPRSTIEMCALCAKRARVAINFAADGEDSHEVKYCDKHAEEFGVKKNPKGLTLIEVCVMLAIIGVLALMVLQVILPKLKDEPTHRVTQGEEIWYTKRPFRVGTGSLQFDNFDTGREIILIGGDPIRIDEIDKFGIEEVRK